MSNGQNDDRLSWGDALFLYLERAGMPLNIASVSIFEGDITLEDCTRFVESKLSLLPRYYQRVVPPPFNVGFPSWEDDPNFDIRNHIKEVTLKRGSERELKVLAGKVLGTTMDRERPLWDFTLVHGLSGNRTSILKRVHHCLADGIAGLGLMNILLDPTPEPHRLPKKKRPSHRRRQRDTWTQLVEGWVSTYSDVLQRVLETQADAVNITERMLGAAKAPSQKFSRFLPELTAPTERLFFNKVYQGPQEFAWAQIPTAAIKAIRERVGATHNDVVLALMTAAIRRYAELHGDKVTGRLLRMMVPVSVRDDQGASELGNRISLLPVTVPLGIRNPRRLLAAVHARTEFLKHAHVAEWVGMAGGLVGAAPAPLQALVGPLVSLLPITPFNLVCTNIRGPNSPLYLLGHKMLDWYPYVPVGGEMTVNCAILSYNGITYFGFSGDVHAAPDLWRIEGLLKLSMNELLSACGIQPLPRRARKKVTKATPDLKSHALAPLSPSTSNSLAEPEPPPKPTTEREAVSVPMAAD
jgi:diacylglycerol O-acyltransferase / wax synthase